MAEQRFFDQEQRFSDLDARLAALQSRRQGEDPRVTQALQAELEVGWIHHDNALEGIVISRQEIKAGIAGDFLAEGRDCATYESIREHKAGIDFILALARAQASLPDRRGLITVQLLRQLHEIVTPLDKLQGSPYRNSTLPHRTYHHAFVGTDTIPLRMRKFCESLDKAPASLHPLAWAAGAHFELMAIFPWRQNNGKMARLLMNLLLVRAGYPPAVIPGSERQPYYESLHTENGRLAGLLADALTSYCHSTERFFDELDELRRHPDRAS